MTTVRSDNRKDFMPRSFPRLRRSLGFPPAAITITKNGNFTALQYKTWANFPLQRYSVATIPSYIRRWGGLTYKLVNNSVHWFTIYIVLALALNLLTMIVLFNAMNNSLPDSCVLPRLTLNEQLFTLHSYFQPSVCLRIFFLIKLQITLITCFTCMNHCAFIV